MENTTPAAEIAIKDSFVQGNCTKTPKLDAIAATKECIYEFVAWRVAQSLGSKDDKGLLGEINRSAPSRNKDEDASIGDQAYANRTSDHNPCPCHLAVCARDITHDPAGGFDAHRFADWLASRLKSGQEMRVKYLISNGRICSGPNQSYRPGVWREYRGQNSHIGHIHISVAHPSGIFDNTEPWGFELHAQQEM